MVTSGMDAMLKVWDIRTYQQLHSIRLHKPTTDLSVSQKGGLVATGHGKHCQVGRGEGSVIYRNLGNFQVNKCCIVI